MSVYEFLAQLIEDILYPPFAKIRQAIAAEPRPDKNKEAINRAISFQCDHFVTSDQATKLGGPGLDHAVHDPRDHSVIPNARDRV